MITTVLFDLDGTLLPFEQEDFIKIYFAELVQTARTHGIRAAADGEIRLGRNQVHGDERRHAAEF